MRRSRLGQTTAAVLAFLFLGTQAAEVYGLHPCPRHHQRAPSARPANPGAPAALGPDSGHDEDPGDDGGMAVCTCVGSCHGGAAAPIPSDGLRSPRLSLPPETLASLPRTRRLPAARAAYFLPFPNGPPGA